MASVSSEPDGGVKEKVTAPYGSWKSPISADAISGGEKRLGGVAVDGRGRLIWLESRPTESGREVLVSEADKDGEQPLDITPKEYGVRTLAQEYGGGAFGVYGDTVIFSNCNDQRLYKQSVIPGDADSPVPITPDYGGPLRCYADGVFDLRFQRFIAVMDDRRESESNPTTTIVAISVNDNVIQPIQEPKLLVSGNDFYAFPRIDPKGERLAWIEWGHPNMPWDRSQLWVGYLSDDGDICTRICVAGGDPSLVESPTEPQWTSEGKYRTNTNNKFRTGKKKLYRRTDSGWSARPPASDPRRRRQQAVVLLVVRQGLKKMESNFYCCLPWILECFERFW